MRGKGQTIQGAGYALSAVTEAGVAWPGICIQFSGNNENIFSQCFLSLWSLRLNSQFYEG